MTGDVARRIDRAFKLAALARMAAGENVSALSRELGVRRKLLYQWRDMVRRGGAEALRGVGRPRHGERAAALVERPPAAVPRRVAVPDELERGGRPVGAYDMLIGAHARSLGLVLVTSNRRAFDRISGLRVESWP